MIGNRKLILTLVTLAAATWLLWSGVIDGATWGTVFAAALATFGVANGIEHASGGTARIEAGPEPGIRDRLSAVFEALAEFGIDVPALMQQINAPPRPEAASVPDDDEAEL